MRFPRTNFSSPRLIVSTSGSSGIILLLYHHRIHIEQIERKSILDDMNQYATPNRAGNLTNRAHRNTHYEHRYAHIPLAMHNAEQNRYE